MDNRSVATESPAAGETDMADAPQVYIDSEGIPQARIPGEIGHEPGHSTARMLPDPSICRARLAGFAGYADCLVEHPFECTYAVFFGLGFFCRHPERNEIVTRTAAQSQ